MSNQKLTPEQIDILFAFVEQRNVKYYDVQMELVDHMASAIEQQWEVEPQLSFELALQNVERQFRRNDFNQIVEVKEKELRTKYRKIERNYIGNFFSWPKIVATSIITFLIYQIFPFFDNYFRFVNLVILADILTVVFLSIVVYPRKHKLEINLNKEFLLLQILKSGQQYFMSVGRLPASILMLIYFSHKISHFPFIDQPVFKVFVALLISLSFIFILATGFYVPNRIKADFIREYPQFVKS